MPVAEDTSSKIKSLSGSTCPLVCSSSSTIGAPTPSLQTTAIADTGSTGNFFTVDTPVLNKCPAVHPIAIHNPNGTVMHSTHEAELDMPSLPLAARKGHIVPDLASLPLVSIGTLCDAGCHVAFTATDVTVTYNDKVVLVGQRTPATRLWHLDLVSQPNQTAAVASESPVDSIPRGMPTVTEMSKPHLVNAAVGSATPAELVAFGHAALFSPALSTLEKALRNRYITHFPGLTLESLRKHPPQSIPMVKGHLDQARKNQRSTKQSAQVLDLEEDDAFPMSPADGARTHYCYVAVMEPTGQVYSDQTGKFVAPSSNGNNYLFIFYDYDSNSIHAEHMRTRHAKSILAAYKIVHARLCAAGLRPKLQRLDNECSDVLKEYMTAEDVEFQLVPPHVHRRNAAERSIRTFKNHFIAGLCSADKDFPIHLWDRLVPQAELTLNLLRGSRINPKLSAWAQIHGIFDFN